MSALLRRRLPTAAANCCSRSVMTMSNMNASPMTKAAGDISSVFPSLSGLAPKPLPERFAHLKQQLIAGREDALQASYDRLLPALASGVAEIREKGPSIIPEISFSELSEAGGIPASKAAEIRRRGAAIIRSVLPEREALDLKASARSYIAANSGRVKAFPPDDPAVYELYWSPPQLRARAHPNMLTAQAALQKLWYSSDPNAEVSTRNPMTYADRFRIRKPGDGKFALGTHTDGGSLERWEDAEYRAVYEKIFDGKWEEYDAFDCAHRLNARMDLYNGAGACAMFRMWQGWLSMSETGPGEGTIKLFPLIRESTAYHLLRPFFSPSTGRLTFPPSTAFPGSVPGACQEFNSTTHPHLQLQHTMTHVPKVYPGDYVAWHCDGLHAVDAKHAGKGDSSVLYIPATPLCPLNTEYAGRQREAFLKGSPPPDFPGAGGEGERGFIGGLREEELSEEGRRAMGLGEKAWEVTADMTKGERSAVEGANRALFGRA